MGPRGRRPHYLRGVHRQSQGDHRRHDPRQEAHSIEDALMRDADRAWRFDRVGIALASGWFGQTPDYYTDRLEEEIVPELITEAATAMAHADLKRSRDLLKTAVLR